MIGHILSLERRNSEASIGQKPAQARHQKRLADMRPGPLKHPGGGCYHSILTTRLPLDYHSMPS